MSIQETIVGGSTSVAQLDVERAVRERYSAAASAAEPALCCPVQYDTRYLQVLPQELIERDYGCGDPSQYVSEGDTVLDLGSGGGSTWPLPRPGRELTGSFDEFKLSPARQDR